MKKCLIFLLAALLLCGCGRTEVPASVPSTELESVSETETLALPEETEAEDPFTFGELRDWAFLFASGAGSWGTWMTVNADGSFQGTLYDHDNDTGEGYPDGTVHWCDFTGQFTQPEKIDADTYAVRISELQYAAGVGTEEMKDRMKYVADEARGLTGGETFYFFCPGISGERLPEAFCQWVHIWPEDGGGELGFYGFYNVEQEFGFSSSKRINESPA